MPCLRTMGMKVLIEPAAVLALEGRVVAELPGDVLGLVHHAGADRAGVDLEQPDDVGLLAADEFRDAGEHARGCCAGSRHPAAADGTPGRCRWHSGCCRRADARSRALGRFESRCSCRAAAPARRALALCAPCARLGGCCPLGLERGSRCRRPTPCVCSSRMPGRQRRLSARVRVPRERAQFLLQELQHAGAAPVRRQGSPARGPAAADRPVEAVIALSSLYVTQPDLLTFQLLFAQASHKAVVLMKPFGGSGEAPKAILDLADEVVGVGRAGAGRCDPPPGASRRDDALGHDRVQARLSLEIRPRPELQRDFPCRTAPGARRRGKPVEAVVRGSIQRHAVAVRRDHRVCLVGGVFAHDRGEQPYHGAGKLDRPRCRTSCAPWHARRPRRAAGARA